ncbi:MAG: DUF1697 domain-containing protein [Solirubrobacterales bacterium]
MATYAAFLRGVNLGAKRKAGSGDLRSCFETAGFDDVATFRNSGNVVFTAPGGGGEAKIRAQLEKALEAEFGFAVAVFLRTAAQVQAIAQLHPFPARAVSGSKGKLQVALLAAKPKAAMRRKVLDLCSDDDQLCFAGRELYWLPSGGTKDSALDMKAIDAALGSTTMRTHGTIEQLAGKFFAG